jgi:hypothetical protein
MVDEYLSPAQVAEASSLVARIQALYAELREVLEDRALAVGLRHEIALNEARLEVILPTRADGGAR